MDEVSAPNESSWPLGPGPSRGTVLLVPLGTPQALTVEAVRAYLAEFLSDPRVVNLPKWLWWPILHGIILRVRPAQSLEKYREVWMAEGAPLRVHSERQAALLQEALRGRGVRVLMAMRYGHPSLAQMLRQWRALDEQRLLVFPLYPQYSGATTGSVIDEVFRELSSWPAYPEVRFVRDFHDDVGYIDALAERVTAKWLQEGRPERLLMSFHGIPVHSVKAGDPYQRECLITASLLAKKLGLSGDGQLASGSQWVIAFQSRFGWAKWLEPDTESVLRQMGRDGVSHVDVVCPGFVSDCLETLEEIGIRAKEVFHAAGGGVFRYLPCLNAQPEMIQFLSAVVLKQLGVTH